MSGGKGLGTSRRNTFRRKISSSIRELANFPPVVEMWEVCYGKKYSMGPDMVD